ncbi:hypothetical protein J6590_048181 [Homalodisca vitripennis]|nr:hypothetical protein J6590_048181 [Homalodisca vitripennis]
MQLHASRDPGLRVCRLRSRAGTTVGSTDLLALWRLPWHSQSPRGIQAPSEYYLSLTDFTPLPSLHEFIGKKVTDHIPQAETCMRRMTEQTTGLRGTERWFMNAYPSKRVCISSTDCPIQLKIPQRLRSNASWCLKHSIMRVNFWHSTGRPPN